MLASANMPAVVVELGYLSNPEQEKVAGNESASVLAQSIVDAAPHRSRGSLAQAAEASDDCRAAPR